MALLYIHFPHWHRPSLTLYFPRWHRPILTLYFPRWHRPSLSQFLQVHRWHRPSLIPYLLFPRWHHPSLTQYFPDRRYTASCSWCSQACDDLPSSLTRYGDLCSPLTRYVALPLRCLFLSSLRCLAFQGQRRAALESPGKVLLLGLCRRCHRR